MYGDKSVSLVRSLFRASPVLGIGVVAVLITLYWSGTFPVTDVTLSARETLALIPEIPKSRKRVVGLDQRYNWFRGASPEANEQLMSIYRNTDVIEMQITIVGILGYTGRKAEAEFLITSLRNRSDELINGRTREQRGDKYLLSGLLNALGNMSRRGVKAASRFLEDVAKGRDSIRIPIASVELTPMWAIDAYAFAAPKDLETTIQDALKRIPEPNLATAKAHDFRAAIRSVKKHEARWIWASELRNLKQKAGSLSLRDFGEPQG